MPTLLFKEVGLVKGVGFDSWRRVGTAMQAVRVYNMREVDELVFLDIAATPSGRGPDVWQIEDLAQDCFMPMTVGGGVRDLGDIEALLMAGADKVAINTAAHASPGLVGEAARRFGVQCIVVGVDVRRAEDTWTLVTRCGRDASDLDPVEQCRRMADEGAGEILLTSVDRDGTMTGYDLEITRRVSEAVPVPVIASGGCGSYDHMYEVLTEGGASAVAAASIFHFTEQTPREAKAHLHARGIATRVA